MRILVYQNFLQLSYLLNEIRIVKLNLSRHSLLPFELLVHTFEFLLAVLELIYQGLDLLGIVVFKYHFTEGSALLVLDSFEA